MELGARQQLQCVSVSAWYGICVWSNVCFLVYSAMCLSLAPLTNGVISYSDRTLGEGAVATHSCNRRYLLIGDTKRTCQSNNKWTLSAPYCAGKGS